MNPVPHAPTPDPLRPPDWRWRAAATDPAEPLRPEPDPAVRAARLYHFALSACRSHADRSRLAAARPHLARAHGIYANAHGVTRAALEARVLADEPRADVARKLNTDPAVVAAYESLFFDVRRRLGSPDYIVQQAIGPRVRTADWGYAVTWKVFGYLGGPAVLDQVLLARPAGARPSGPGEVADFLIGEGRAAVRRKLTAAAWAAADLSKIAALGRAVGDPAADRDGGGDLQSKRISEHIQAMVTELPFMFGTEGRELEPPLLRELDQKATELRDDELHVLASGGTLSPEQMAELEIVLPPPRRARTAGLTDPPAPTPPAKGDPPKK